LGLAILLGYKLMTNFNSPYQATDITDFWHRWHISLSTWLRDYLYIVLGGNRGGKIKQYTNLLITMLIGGLWHGASWKFVVWGGMHGLGLAIHKFWKSNSYKIKIPLLNKILGWFITFHFVAFLWIFFRATTFETALTAIVSMFSDTSLDYVMPFMEVRGLFLLILLIGYILHLLDNQLKEKISIWFSQTHFIIWLITFIIIIQLILQLQSSEVQPFIYFQF